LINNHALEIFPITQKFPKILVGTTVEEITSSLFKKKIIINGNRKKFEAIKLSVLERTYGK
jgi:hypothetical protein